MQKKSLTLKSWFVATNLVMILSLAIANVSAQTTFPANAASLGAIPDTSLTTPTCGNASTSFRDVTFTVSGLSGSVSAVAVNFNGTHTYINDLEVSLRGPGVAPGGTPSHLLFARSGTTATTANACGYASDLVAANTYSFADAATTNWWTAAAVTPIAAGNYRTVITGEGGVTPPPATTSLNTAFAGVTNANGTWTLRFRDQGVGDTGTVTAANLIITTAAATRPALLDYNGDGKTDYAVIRDNGGPNFAELNQMPNRAGLKRTPDEMLAARMARAEIPEAPQARVNWYVLLNGGAPTGLQWGIDTDFFIGGDYDGDRKTDYTIWRQGAPGVAAFYILQSQTNTVRIEAFGQTGDDVSVVGDYNGDGRTDLASYRLSGSGNTFFWRTTANGPVTFAPWGTNGVASFLDYPYVGDFDGDGKTDIGIQRDQTTASGIADHFVYRRSSDSAAVYVNWGNLANINFPGDFDGDGRTDFVATQTNAGTTQYNVLLSGGGTQVFQFGLTANTIAPGDYDGDGKTDVAVFNSTNGNFYVRQSSNSATTAVQWGANGFVPVGNYVVIQ